MSKKNIAIRFAMALCVLCATHFTVLADPFGFDDPEDDAPEQVPVDGGLSLLVAGGIAYGVKRAKDWRKQKQEL